MKTIKIFIAALVLFTIALPACKNRAKKATVPTTDSIPVADTLAEPAATIPDSTQAAIQDSVPVIENEEAVTIKEDNKLNAQDFYVIGGSFKELDRANKFAAELKTKGYESTVLKPVNGFNRVAIRAYETQEKARTELAKLRSDFHNVTYWLLLPITK